ncbi:hypothetical protein POM88_007019 [Heracleum sosnowskyi]|uniref:F-box associated beta-propeller type 1 domain-containing protein n=1 Tax=Heracleum sosnowskyi TaxID=360622 RepID=A0AAD8N633_9APIA|nr:hypothetical protein POM88_007019 [Heracleum sosnowskyi]
MIYKTLRVSPLSVFTPEEIEWKGLAFGYLPEVDDYVVVHVVKLEPDPADPSDPDAPDPREFNPNTVAIGVYSQNTSSWKTIFQDDVPLYALCSEKSVFVNGTAFWVAQDFDEQFVMYFDTKKEILREILVPDYFGILDRQFDNPVIHPFGQSIAYFVEDDESHHLDIWLLKEDVINEFSWEKKLSVSLSENIRADVLGIRNNGEPILTKSNDLISYDLDTYEPYVFVNSCDCLTPDFSYQPFAITPFVETLLWRDK